MINYIQLKGACVGECECSEAEKDHAEELKSQEKKKETKRIIDPNQ